MKLSLIFVVTCLWTSSIAQNPQTGGRGSLALMPTQAPMLAPNLAQELDELYRLINIEPLKNLIRRYLLNDAQFQAFIRIINSQDFFFARFRFRSQPEVLSFLNWVRMQMVASGGQFEFGDSEESLEIFNKSPYWANSVYGWQGFVNEFLAYYSQDMIKSHINMKVSQGGVFAQFWQRVKGLKPVYERFLSFPETQRVIGNLHANGIDSNPIDNFIRTQFDWLNPTAAANNATTPAPAGFARSMSRFPPLAPFIQG